MQQVQNNQNRLRINYFIKVPEVKVIDEDGTFLGVMKTNDAIKLATERALDLIEVNPKAVPPICKITSIGKFKYEEKKKANVAKKNQKVSELKEIILRPATEEHDLKHKLASAKDFLKEGHKVKFTVKFKGREMSHPEIGQDKLNFVLSQLTDITSTSISMEGRTMSTIVSAKSEK